MSQLARRENAPHRAAFVASPSRWRIHSVRDNAPPFHPCLCGEEAPFLFLAEQVHPIAMLRRNQGAPLPARRVVGQFEKGRLRCGALPHVPPGRGLAKPSETPYLCVQKGPERSRAPAPGTGWFFQGLPSGKRLGSIYPMETPNGVAALLGVAFLIGPALFSSGFYS